VYFCSYNIEFISLLITFILIFLASLTLLLIASDKFVDAAENIGLAMGIPSFIVGVTIIAVGTSLPELATSIASVFSGTSEIVVANVVGSNVTNILLVLGATAVVGKGISLDYDVMTTDMTKLIASAFLLYFMLIDGTLSTFDCIIMLAALVIFLASSFSVKSEDEEDKPSLRPIDFGILAIASVFIFLGAKYTIYGLENIASLLEIPPHIIAITAVALGTSLPEVVVSITAARKGKHAMAVGNVLGSNIFNTYAVMGITGLIGNLTIPQDAIVLSIPFMIAATILFAISCMTKHISKYEGWLFLLLYIFFIAISLDSQSFN